MPALVAAPDHPGGLELREVAEAIPAAPEAVVAPEAREFDIVLEPIGGASLAHALGNVSHIDQ